MTTPAIERRQFNFNWLVNLRWAILGGKVALVVLMSAALTLDVPLIPLVVLLAVEAGFNMGCWLWSRREPAVSTAALGVTMMVDLAMLTGLLYLSGGPFNPFSIFYLVNVVLGAAVLPVRWAWALAGLSFGCFAMMFFWHVPVPGIDHGMGMHDGHGDEGSALDLHLQGMLVAYGAAAAFVAWYTTRLSRALSEREAELEVQRQKQARMAHIESLATLAAGAAHELATPLSTIAVVTKELNLILGEEPDADDLEDARKDLVLMRGEVERCKEILDHMALEAGASRGDSPEVVQLDVIAAQARTGAGGDQSVRVTLDVPKVSVEVPVAGVKQALRAIIRNAIDASEPDAEVLVRAGSDEHRVWIEVVDEGHGIPPELRDRIGEPFFTTKDVGEGVGLGVFLARSVFSRLGGSLEILPQPRGTIARAEFPLSMARRISSA